MFEPTSADVKAYRISHECGSHEAWKALRKSMLLDAAKSAQTLEELRAVVVAIVSAKD